MSALPGPPAGPERHDVQRTMAALLGSRREASWLLEETVGPGRATDRLSEEDADRLHRLAARRRAREPLQYLLGHWPFREVDLTVDRRALIPRPETEWVTEVALRELDLILAAGGRARVADLGTGTGAIALSIATERAGHNVSVVATERDPGVLELAAANLTRVAAASRAELRVELRTGSWWEALAAEERGGISLVVSNPPYVSAVEWELLDPVVRDHEPYAALVAGPGNEGTPGFAAVEAVVTGAGPWLARPGTAVVEIAPSQAPAALSAAARAGSSEARVLDDLSGRPRALVARWR